MLKKEPIFPDGLPRFWALPPLLVGVWITVVGFMSLVSSTSSSNESDTIVRDTIVFFVCLGSYYWALKIWTNRLGHKQHIRSFFGIDEFFVLEGGRTYNHGLMIGPLTMIAVLIPFKALKNPDVPPTFPDADSTAAKSVLEEAKAGFIQGLPIGLITRAELTAILSRYSEICTVNDTSECTKRTNLDLQLGTALATALLDVDGPTVTMKTEYTFTLKDEGVCDTGLSSLVVDGPADVKLYVKESAKEFYRSFPERCTHYSNVSAIQNGFRATAHGILMAKDGTWYHTPQTESVLFR